MARRAHEPDPKGRLLVQMMAINGVNQADIARAIGIDLKTLLKYYRNELDDGLNSLNAKVAGALLKQCMDGDVTAQIFWLKCRAKWNQKAGEVGDDKQDWLKAYAMEMTAHLKAKHEAGP